MLLLDADAARAGATRLRFELDGYRITVTGLEGAVERIRATGADIVALDLDGPGYEPLALLDRLLEASDLAAVPFLIMSRCSGRELAARGVDVMRPNIVLVRKPIMAAGSLLTGTGAEIAS